MRGKFSNLILIYTDRLPNRRYFNNLDIPFRITTDFDEYKNALNVFKVAISNDRFGIHGNCSSLVKPLHDIGSYSDLVFLIETEFHSDTVEAGYQYPTNVYCIVSGYTTELSAYFHTVFSPSWPKMAADLYNNLPDVLEKFTPYDAKPKMFDMLLGRVKPHRTFVYDSVIANNLLDKNIVNYNINYYSDQDNFFTEENFIWEPVEPLETPKGSANRVRYLGHETALAVVIPVEVYQTTAYSVVTETDTDNRFSFFTEKVAKPIIGRRLFVVFSGYKYLHNLRQAGFKTFDGIIDESYDLIIDPTERFSAAFEQLRQLCFRDQREVLDLVRPIVDHNYNMLMNTDWEQQKSDQIIKLIKTKYEHH